MKLIVTSTYLLQLLLLLLNNSLAFYNLSKFINKNVKNTIVYSNKQTNAIESIKNLIINKAKENKSKQLLIGLVGPPGSGKSTISSQLVASLKDFNAVILPMDGYHYTKKQLNDFDDPIEAFKRRGSHWTFDGASFVNSIKNLRKNGEGNFPSFDHAIGDPIDDDIRININNKIVIIEGNYLLLKNDPWNKLKELLDLQIFLNCDEETLRYRIVNRHIRVGCTPDEAVVRFETNDLLNAREIVSNSALESVYLFDSS